MARPTPGRLQLYSLATPNGVKVSVVLEECGLPYEARRISFETQDQFSSAFIATFPGIDAMDASLPTGKEMGALR